jgi:hypothetical protein
MAEHPPPPEGLQFWFFVLQLAHLELFASRYDGQRIFCAGQ